MRWTLIMVLGKYFVSFQQKKLPFIKKKLPLKKVASKKKKVQPFETSHGKDPLQFPKQYYENRKARIIGFESQDKTS